MYKRCALTIMIILCPILYFYFNNSYLYAGTLDKEAISYREKAYHAQEIGDIDSAITWYQKSAVLDPNYAAPHNDLGILFETKGWLDRAETEYQRALAIDPSYEKAHTNLALLYERKGELEKAGFHWLKRYQLGDPADYWTQESKRRLEKLGLIAKEKQEGTEPINKIGKKGTSAEREKLANGKLESDLKEKWLGSAEYKRRKAKELERQRRLFEQEKLRKEKEKKRLEERKVEDERKRKARSERQKIKDERKRKRIEEKRRLEEKKEKENSKKTDPKTEEKKKHIIR